MESEKIEFRSLLRALRIRKGPTWKQPVMADALGFSHRLYVAWENGESVPSTKKLRRIADYFKLNREYEEELYRAAAQAPPRIHNFPFSQNTFFTGRETHLERLSKLLQESGTVEITQSVGISGLGGIGKTQLALEYAYRHYPKVYLTVLWVNAADGTTLQASYDSIAKLLELPERDEREADKRVQAVKRWLEEHTSWLLVMDNADDLQLARSFLPSKPLGHVVFTTRSQIVRDSNIAVQIQLEEMTLEEGLLFLLQRSGVIQGETTLAAVDSKVRESAQQLVELLGKHPLALDQAGAYIEETGVSIADYIQLYQEEHSFLLNKNSPDPPGTNYHPETVVATVRLSFRKACIRYPAAEDVLYFCSFLQPDAMPEEVFYQADSLKLDAKSFNAVMAALRRYSLIKRNAQEKILSMHRLVQSVLRDGITPDLRKQWQERVARALNAAFPEVDFEEWAKCGRLLPHAVICMTWEKHEQYFISEASDLLNKAGTYLIERGQYSDAEPLLMHALLIRRRLLGEDHLDIARTLNNLASLYRRQGKYDEAEPFYRQALTIREKLLGTEHPETARSLNNLAIFYQSQKEYKQAESLYQRTIAIYELHLGSDHPDVARTLNNLAILYKDQGKYEEAELVYQRTIAIYERHLGMEHPDIARTLNNLAVLHVYQGKYEQAELLYQRALSIREKCLGADHPATAISLYRLATLYQHTGNYKEAEALFQRTLSIQEQLLELTHPDTLATRKSYSTLLRTMGHDAEAVALERNDEPTV